jgi:hypothetical protein
MTRSALLSNGLGLIGALVGGALGFFAFGWMYRRGFYAMVLPGGLIGIGCGLLARHESWARGVACAVLAVIAGLLAEWYFIDPFGDNPGFLYFLRHLGDVSAPTVTFGLIAVGAAAALWLGRGRYLAPKGGSAKAPTTARERE